MHPRNAVYTLILYPQLLSISRLVPNLSEQDDRCQKLRQREGKPMPLSSLTFTVRLSRTIGSNLNYPTSKSVHKNLLAVSNRSIAPAEERSLANLRRIGKCKLLIELNSKPGNSGTGNREPSA